MGWDEVFELPLSRRDTYLQEALEKAHPGLSSPHHPGGDLSSAFPPERRVSHEGFETIDPKTCITDWKNRLEAARRPELTKVCSLRQAAESKIQSLITASKLDAASGRKVDRKLVVRKANIEEVNSKPNKTQKTRDQRAAAKPLRDKERGAREEGETKNKKKKKKNKKEDVPA